MRKHLIFIIVLAYLVYGSFYIFNSSFEVNGERYYCLFDDAMITMRYAKNLAMSGEPYWNSPTLVANESVQGYTNPLWMLLMTALHFLPIAASKVSLVIQLVGMILSSGTIFIVYKICEYFRHDKPVIAVASALLTALYLPLNFWALMGMEVSLLVFTTSLSFLMICKSVEKQRMDYRVYVLGAIAILARMDAVLIMFVLCAFAFYKIKPERKSIILFSSVFMVLPLLMQFAFSYIVYGDWLPNTYYLKMTGYPMFLRITKGIYALIKFLIFMNPIFPILFVYTVIKSKKAEFYCIGVLFTILSLYSIYAGGDAWEWWGGSNRYISPAIPLFFIIIAISLDSFTEKLILRIKTFLPALSKNVIYFSLILLSLLFVNSIHGPKALCELLLLEKPLGTADNKLFVEFAQQIDTITNQDASISVVTAGTLPYFLNRHAIDLLGKNDRFVARKQGKVAHGIERFWNYNPGHIKWDYEYSIAQLQPDVVWQLWFDDDDIKDYLNLNYIKVQFGNFEFYAKKDSKNIFWQKMK